MTHDDSTKEDSRLNTLSLAEQRTHKRMELLASEVAREFCARAKKLRALRPEIERIKRHFSEHVRGSVTLAGCRSFKQYCETKLEKTEQGVYAMLGEYHKRRKEKENRIQKEKPSAGILDSPANQDAALRALDAMARFRVAYRSGDKDSADALLGEYEQIADQEALKSRIDGDRPNYEKLLRDVLDAAKAIETAALQLHAALSNIVESGVLAEGTALLASTRMALSGAEELLGAGRSLAAVRRRLGIVAGDEVRAAA